MFGRRTHFRVLKHAHPRKANWRTPNRLEGPHDSGKQTFPQNTEAETAMPKLNSKPGDTYL